MHIHCVHVHDVLGPEDGVAEGLTSDSGPRSSRVGREDIAVGLGVSTLIKRDTIWIIRGWRVYIVGG